MIFCLVPHAVVPWCPEKANDSGESQLNDLSVTLYINLPRGDKIEGMLTCMNYVYIYTLYVYVFIYVKHMYRCVSYINQPIGDKSEAIVTCRIYI